MLQQRPQQRLRDPEAPDNLELESLLVDRQPETPKASSLEEDQAYRLRVEEAKRTCRQRRYCTYLVLVIYLIILLIYLRRRKQED